MILTENEQSFEGVWAQGQTAQRTGRSVKSGSSPQRGSVAPSQFGKGCKPSEILRQRTIDPLLPGFQLLKANVK